MGVDTLGALGLAFAVPGSTGGRDTGLVNMGTAAACITLMSEAGIKPKITTTMVPMTMGMAIPLSGAASRLGPGPRYWIGDRRP